MRTCSFPSAQAPVVVVNGASFTSLFPIAPGSYAQVFGALTGTVPNASANLAQLPLPDNLGGVQVQVEGVTARLYAVAANVSGEQDAVAFLVPQATQPGRRTVRVLLTGQAIGQGTLDVLPSSPGIFFGRTAEGLDIGGVLNQSNQYAVQATPARRGEVIQIFLTGQGTGLTAAVPDGNVPPPAPWCELPPNRKFTSPLTRHNCSTAASTVCSPVYGK